VASEPVHPVRAHAGALVAATVVALVVDAALQLVLDAVRVSGRDSGVPWWITANLIPRGRWVALATLLWAIGPRFPGAVEDEAGEAQGGASVPGPEAWRRVGVAVIALPLLWVVATWAVTAVRFTLLGSWATDGRVFLAPEYYRGLIVEYVPWLLAGAALLTTRRHL